jgi:hypothetical protein
MSVSEALHCGGRVPGNREVPRLALRAQRAAHGEEGGVWGKHGFPRGSEAPLSDAVER